MAANYDPPNKDKKEENTKKYPIRNPTDWALAFSTFAAVASTKKQYIDRHLVHLYVHYYAHGSSGTSRDVVEVRQGLPPEGSH